MALTDKRRAHRSAMLHIFKTQACPTPPSSDGRLSRDIMILVMF